MSARDLTCHGCLWLETLAKKLPHDLADHLCRQRDWGGYVDPTLPACLGSSNGARRLIAFAPLRGVDDWIEGGGDDGVERNPVPAQRTTQ